MMDTIIRIATNPEVLVAALVSVAVFATILTLLPSTGGPSLRSRMKTVALERDELRARQKARLAAEAERNRGKRLRRQDTSGVRSIVERLDLRRALADEKTTQQLRNAGFRSESAMTRFLFLRFALPFAGAGLVFVWIYFGNGLAAQPTMYKVLACIFAAYGGFYAPVIYVSNAATKRKQSIQLAWPDALDLMLICVESGMSAEAAFRRVADEIGSQSVALAEELVLTMAELSFLPERRQAYENLANRTGLDSVKSVTQALIQAERYGTPIGSALRVMAEESREHRMNEAEKKAAALPPKLTVPMILFFLPVLFVVIMGPAVMSLKGAGFM